MMLGFLKRKNKSNGLVKISDKRLEFSQVICVNDKYGILADRIGIGDLISFVIEKVFYRGYDISKDGKVLLNFEMSSKYSNTGNYAPPSNLRFSFLVSSGEDNLKIDPSEARLNVDPPGICDGLTWYNSSAFYKDKKNQDDLDYFFTAYTMLGDKVKYGCFYINITTFFYIQHIITRLCTHQPLDKFSGILTNISGVRSVGKFSFNVDIDFNGFALSTNNRVLFVALRINKLIPCIVSCAIKKMTYTDSKEIREKKSYIRDFDLDNLPMDYIYISNHTELSYIRDDDPEQRIFVTFAYTEPPVLRDHKEPYRFIQVYPKAYSNMMEKVIDYVVDEVSETLEFRII